MGGEPEVRGLAATAAAERNAGARERRVVGLGRVLRILHQPSKPSREPRGNATRGRAGVREETAPNGRLRDSGLKRGQLHRRRRRRRRGVPHPRRESNRAELLRRGRLPEV